MIAAIGLGALAGDALAETTIVRPGPCAAQSVYLLAGHSGALVLVEPDEGERIGRRVIVFRHNPTRGWASQRLLRRFDLRLGDDGVRIVNSGVFCKGSE